MSGPVFIAQVIRWGAWIEPCPIIFSEHGVRTGSSSLQMSMAIVLALGCVAPAFAAEGQYDKDCKSHRPYQKQNGGASPSPLQRPNPAMSLRAPARATAPVHQPAVRIPQNAPAPVVRVPQIEPRRASGAEVPRGPQLDRRGGGERRFESYRRHDGDRRRAAGRYGGHRRWALGAGIVIIGGILGYEAYRGRDRDDLFDRCDQNFPDFDYDTGSFVNDDGEREICPYLID